MKLYHHSEWNEHFEFAASSYGEILKLVKKWSASEGKGKQWPETEEEIDAVAASIPSWVYYNPLERDLGDLKHHLKELALVDAGAKKREMEEMVEGLRVLASRLKEDPLIPEVPHEISDEAREDKLPEGSDHWTYRYNEDADFEHWRKFYPSLDRATMAALMEMSDNDLFPHGVLAAYGSHYASQDWDLDELREIADWVRNARGRWDFSHSNVDLSSKSRAELIAELTRGYIEMNIDGDDGYSGYCADLDELRNFAKTLQDIPTDELKEFFEDMGVFVSETARPSLILSVVECVYADVLEPSEPRGSEQPSAKRKKVSA